MLIDDINSIPGMFTCGVRGILLLERNKDGDVGNAQVSTNSEEWKNIVLELMEMQKSTHKNYRIYSSVNSRDIDKAIHEFKRRQLEAEYGNLNENHMFYTDINYRFFSCLMNPKSRLTRYFLIECDSIEEYEFAKLQLQSTRRIVMEYETKNGKHLITHPFNPKDYGGMKIHKDDLMFIG